MRVQNLNVGVDSVSRLRVGEDAPLPQEGTLHPVFMPVPQALDEVLKRPSLDERLPALLQPETLDTELLEPTALSHTREEIRNILTAKADLETGANKEALDYAVAYLNDAVALDDEVRHALAALLKG